MAVVPYILVKILPVITAIILIAKYVAPITTITSVFNPILEVLVAVTNITILLYV